MAVTRTADGQVEHTLLTTLVDKHGTMRVQYLGFRFDPEEFRHDLHGAAARALTRIRDRVVDTVSRLPARVQTKLLVAFLAMAALLMLLGAVGLQALHGVNRQTEELIRLQRKIAAFRQVQHDTTAQLYGVTSALLAPDEPVLQATLRQLTQFGYDLDRLQYVASDEVELLARVRGDYDRFIAIVTRVVELAGAGQAAEARKVQRDEAGPLADRLERLTNQLVNLAEAEMISGIDASQQAYARAWWIVVAIALGQRAPGAGARLRHLLVADRPGDRDQGPAARHRRRRLHRPGRGGEPRRAGRARRQSQPHRAQAGAALRAA